MKKILFSISCGLILATLASCQSEADIPEAPSFGGKTIEASFPAGAKVAKVNVGVPDEAKTRAGEVDLPLWGVNESSFDGSLTLRYAVYNEDGSLYWSSDKAETLPTSKTDKFDLTIPLPAVSENYKLFVWADKIPQSSFTTAPSVYDIDWENKTVSIKRNSTKEKDRYNEMNIDGDAFCFWGDITAGQSNSITLERPFVQINVLTDEFDNNETLYKDCYRICSRMNLTTIETLNDEILYLRNRQLPTVWHWEDDTFDFDKKVSDYNLSYNLAIANPSAPNPADRFKFHGIIDGKKMVYVGVFYMFAPRAKAAYVNAATGETLNVLQFYTRSEDEEGYNLSYRNVFIPNIPAFKANDRVVITSSTSNTPGPGINPPDPDNPGGLFTKNTKLDISVNGIQSSTTTL